MRILNNKITFGALIMAALFFCCSSETAFCGGQEADPDKPMYDKVMSVAKSVRTLECSFTETKTIAVLSSSLVSRGKLYYKRPDYLRWEYTSPSSYYGICNPQVGYLIRDGKKDMGGSRAFVQIGKNITKIMSGEPVDRKQFTLNYRKEKGDFIVVLMPKTQRLKAAIDYIMMHFDMNTGYIKSYETHHRNDSDKIVFSNRKTNEQIDDSMFR